MADPYLLLVTSRRISRCQTVYGGICIGERPSGDMLENGWQAWLVGQRHGPMAVTLVDHQVETIHLNTSEGSFWRVDGQKVGDGHGDDAARLIELARNSIGDVKFTPPLDVLLPVFIGDDPGLRPCRDDLVVKMTVARIIDLPEAAVAQTECEIMFGFTGSVTQKRRSLLEAMAPFAGLELPVEFGDGAFPAHGVLHLRDAAGEGIFRCRLYRSDQRVRPTPGTVFRRRAQRHLASQTIRREGDVAVVLSVESSGAIEPEEIGAGIVRRRPDGKAPAITCTSYGRAFTPERFTPEEREVTDLWGWLHPLCKERAPRFDVERRLSFVSESAARYERKLRGRRVSCPACGSGILRLV